MAFFRSCPPAPVRVQPVEGPSRVKQNINMYLIIFFLNVMVFFLELAAAFQVQEDSYALMLKNTVE